jgi:hypothetical protein
MENLSEQSEFRKEEAYLRAKKKVDSIKGFYWHLAVYLVINSFIVTLVVTNVNVGVLSFEALSTPIFWGIGLVFHFLGVFGSDFLFGQNWEKRKIKEFMDKESKLWDNNNN